MKFSNRAQKLTGSSTMAATLAAQKKIQSGENIILGTIGEPDGDIPEIVKLQIKELLKTPSKYGPAQGLSLVRNVVANWMSSLYNQNWTSDNVIITPGSKFSLYALFQIFCESGDEVLIPIPSWVSYENLAELSGAKIIKAPCFADTNYKITSEKLDSYLSQNPKIKILVLNSPNNPTGSIYSQEELKKIAKVIENYPDLYVLSDDIYNQLIFSSESRAPHLLDYISPEAFERIIVIHGASKSFALTGWRIGWTIATKPCIEKLTQFQSQTLTCVPDLLQLSLIPLLQSDNSFVTDLKKRIYHRYELALKHLSGCKSIRISPSEGAFYLWIEMINSKLNSETVVQELLHQKGLALIPGTSFGTENHLRFSLTLPDDKLIEGLNRLRDYFK